MNWYERWEAYGRLILGIFLGKTPESGPPLVEQKTSSQANSTMETYLFIGSLLGILAAIVAFVGGWIYAIAAEGFVLGLGLGWLAAGILAVIVSFVVRWFWGPILLILVVATLT